MSNRILIVQRRMTHYRVAFFESLRQQLADKGLELVLAHGEGTDEEKLKNDGAELAWAQLLPTRYLFGERICYQPLKSMCDGVAMIILTQENKLVCNLWHQFGPVPYKVALWGHGANLQGNSASIREKFKRQVSRQADWWFGYTEHTRPLIAQTGFPESRITVLNNAVDTTEMRRQFEAIDPATLTRWRSTQGLGVGPTGIFLGSFYKEKRIDFLLAAAKAIHSQVADFKLLLVGSGPQKAMVEAFCNVHPWAHFAGMLKGQEKVLALASATVMLNPGLVGLGVLDSFACEVPIVTTDCGLHSPEITYLQSGRNGLITENSLNGYVQECVALISDPMKLLALRNNCRDSANEYTIENMARNFVNGVERCLQSAPYKTWCIR